MYIETFCDKESKKHLQTILSKKDNIFTNI